MRKNERLLWRIRSWVSIFGLFMAVLGAIMAYFNSTDHVWRMINLIVWTLGPPIWFMVEYCYLYPLLDDDPAHKNDLKYGQGLAKAFWAGIGALLIAIYKIQGG